MKLCFYLVELVIDYPVTFPVFSECELSDFLKCVCLCGGGGGGSTLFESLRVLQQEKRGSPYYLILNKVETY